MFLYYASVTAINRFPFFVKQTTKMAILLLGMQAFTFITATNYDKSKINAKTLHQYK